MAELWFNPLTTNSEIYANIGRAISTWASVEDALFELYSFSIKQNKDLAAVAFYRSTVFNSKLSLTNDTLSKLDVDVIIKEKWEMLFHILDKLRIERNFIAHNPVVVLPLNSADLQSQPSEPTQINASYEAKYTGRPKKELSLEQIAALTEDFLSANKSLLILCMLIGGFVPSPGTDYERVVDQRLEKYLPDRLRPKV